MTLLHTAVETAVSEVHKLLHTGGVPTSLTLLFWWCSGLYRSEHTDVLFMSLPPHATARGCTSHVFTPTRHSTWLYYSCLYPHTPQHAAVLFMSLPPHATTCGCTIHVFTPTPHSMRLYYSCPHTPTPSPNKPSGFCGCKAPCLLSSSCDIRR